MKLTVKTDRNIIEDIEISFPVSLEKLAERIQGECPYRILLARVNGVDRELAEKIDPERDFAGSDELVIEFLDMRTHSAELTYQRGISMIYLKAVKDVLGADAIIDNSLNQGLYTKVRREQELTEGEVRRVEARMWEITEANLPFERITMSRDRGVEFWQNAGFALKAELLAGPCREDYRAVFYSLDGYVNYFFGQMVPSTGYLNFFELRKYGRGILIRYPKYKEPDRLPDYQGEQNIYEAFGEAHDWLELLGTKYLPMLNSITVNGGVKEMILLSEALHEKKIAEIADRITRKRKRIILIAGPSSSGKTTFARRLCVQLRVNGLKPLYMGTDDYFVNRVETPRDEDGNYNYEDLEAIDIDLFNSNMNDLLSGRSVDLPEFDFIKGEKVFGKRITSITDDQPIVIEGIHALNGKLTEQISDEHKFRIYISPLTQLNMDVHNRVPSSDARMLRRMVRDFKYRNHTAAETIQNWPKVRDGEEKNIFPFTKEADVLFNSNLAYETPLLKKYVEPLLGGIEEKQPEYSEAVRLLELLRFFRVIKEEDYVPNNSIIREFIGGSVFTE